MQATPLRRRIAGATMALGAVLVGMSVFAPSASAGAGTDPFFNTDTDTYDSYLHDAHRGTPATASFPGDCPSDASVDGITAWHLILTDNDQDYSTIDVRVSIDGVAETRTLTMKAKGDWAGFDPLTNFMADPNAKHAYVYAGDGDDVLVDAAAQLTPDGAGDKMVLSHICPADDGGGTTGGTTGRGGDTTTGTTGTTDDVEATTGEATTGEATSGEATTTSGGETPEPDNEVLGEVITPAAPQALPATGDNDQSLAIIGAALVLIGGGVMLLRKDLLGRS